MDRCQSSPRDRKRIFWATQPCDLEPDPCEGVCVVPGLKRQDIDGGTTIDNSNWIKGLILNILNTDSRVPNSLCGIHPAAVKGHWSESFLDGNRLFMNAPRGYRVGTSLRQIDVRKYGTNELASIIQSTLKKDLTKLVQIGLAISIEAEVGYKGNRSFCAEVSVFGPASTPVARVSLSARPSADIGFYWSA